VTIMPGRAAHRPSTPVLALRADPREEPCRRCSHRPAAAGCHAPARGHSRPPLRWRRRSPARMHAPPSREDAADRVRDCRDELRSGIRLGRGLRRGDRQHHRVDARLRLPRASGAARAAHARVAADGRGRWPHLCVPRAQGVMFTPDPAFKGAPRELTAADYAYSIKRHLDPVQRSPWAWLIEGKLVGGDEAQAAAKRSAGSTTTRRCPASRSSTATR